MTTSAKSNALDADINEPPTRHWGRVALALVAFKLAYFACLFVALTCWRDFDTTRAEQIQRGWFVEDWPPESRGPWAKHFATWDAEHYLYLSANGYDAGVRSIAFYPLWPLGLRAFHAATGLPRELGGVLLANLFSVVGLVMFHRLSARRYGERTADLAVGLLLVFPGSLFVQFVYSESLFFLLVMVLWWGLERGCYVTAWVAAFLSPLARGVGVFGLLPLGWHWLMTRRWTWLDRWNWLERERNAAPKGVGVSSLWPSALLLAPLCGWGLYLGLMWVWTGNALAGVEAQAHWKAHSISNLWDLPRFVAGFFEVTCWHGFKGSALDRVAFLPLLYAFPLLWRMDKDLIPWTIMLGLLPAMSGTFVSFLRFEACAFPVFLAWAWFLQRTNSRWPVFAVLAINGLLHAILVWRFVNYRWAG